MPRRVALLILLAFAAGAVALAWWGWTDLQAWRAAVADCRERVVMDTTSFWFLGLISVALLPFLSVVGRGLHRPLFVLALALFFGLPYWASTALTGQAAAAGYDMTGFPGLFRLQAFEITAPETGCGA